MTDDEMVTALHGMADAFGKMLKSPMLDGALPTLRLSFKDGLVLTVGAEMKDDDEAEEDAP